MTQTRPKRNRNPRKAPSSQKLQFLRLINEAVVLTTNQLTDLFSDLSQERIRGILAERQREGLIGSSDLPKSKNAKFYYIRKKGLRLINKKNPKTHHSQFKPGALYDDFARSLFFTAEIAAPGKPARRLFRPKDFEDKFPQYCNHFRGKHYCIDATGHIYALQPIKNPPGHRILKDNLKRFRPYTEHRRWRQLITAGKFSFVLLLPTEGKAEEVQRELLKRAKRREKYSPTGEATPLENIFAECVVCFPRPELGRMLL